MDLISLLPTIFQLFPFPFSLGRLCLPSNGAVGGGHCVEGHCKLQLEGVGARHRKSPSGSRAGPWWGPRGKVPRIFGDFQF